MIMKSHTICSQISNKPTYCARFSSSGAISMITMRIFIDKLMSVDVFMSFQAKKCLQFLGHIMNDICREIGDIRSFGSCDNIWHVYNEQAIDYVNSRALQTWCQYWTWVNEPNTWCSEQAWRSLPQGRKSDGRVNQATSEWEDGSDQAALSSDFIPKLLSNVHLTEEFISIACNYMK